MSERLKSPQPENITPKTDASFNINPLTPDDQADDLELTDKERNQRAYQEKTAERYDELLQERENLQKKLLRYDSRDNVLFAEGMLTDSKVKLINSEWLQAVREQTEFLKPLDELGIKIFTNNLANQPKFPNIKISFGSAEIAKKQTRDLRNVGGNAGRSKINVGSKDLDLRQQLFSFMRTGELDDTTNILIHELIHCYHHADPYEGVDKEVTEAQAYWSGILAGKFRFVETLKTLIEPKEKGGLYQFDDEEITRLLMCIATLNGLGKSEKEVADLIRITKYNSEGNKFSPLEDELEKLMEADGLDDIDAQAAHDLYRLHTTNQRLKARLLLNESIQKNISEEERLRLEKKRMDALQSHFLQPTYYDAEGKALQEKDATLLPYQFVILPDTKEFPYAFNGKRTGVIFGLFHNTTTKKIEFELGRWEGSDNKSKVVPAISEKDKKKLLDIMKKHAEIISFDEKSRLLNTAVRCGELFFGDETAKKIINTFISSGEAKEILYNQQYAEDFLNVYDGMKADKMNEYKFEEDLKDKWEEKMKAYTPMVESYLEYLKIFNLNPNELSPAIAVPLKNITVWLKNCQAILDKHAITPISVGLE